jgi:hypothetical protein
MILHPQQTLYSLKSMGVQPTCVLEHVVLSFTVAGQHGLSPRVA